MEDFNALASSLAAGVVDVRGCLILSRDGMVLGVHPSEGEIQTKPAWLRFATIGDPERGFAQFGSETWCYVRRGPYAAFAVVGLGARPGLVIDHIEQVLLVAEESRGKRSGVGIESATPPPVLPTSKPRTPLHVEHPIEEPILIDVDASSAAVDAADAPPPLIPTTGSDGSPLTEVGSVESPDALDQVPSTEPTEPEGAEAPRPAGALDPRDRDDEVDRFALSREFGELLQDDENGADGYSTRDRRT